MFLPVIFAIMVWYLAMRWRRQWPAFTAVTAAAGLLIAVGYGARHIGANAERRPPQPGAVIVQTPTPAAAAATPLAAGPAFTAARPGVPFRHPVVEALLWPYAGLVIGIGLFIACLPRSAPSDGHCRRCHYDLTGADPDGLLCSECGFAQEYKCRACGCDFAGLDPVGLRCPDCNTQWQGPGWQGVVIPRQV